MKTGIFTLAAILLLGAFSAPGQENYLKADFAPKEWGKYAARSQEEGVGRWQAQWVLERRQIGPPEIYRVRDEARGLFGHDNRWEERIVEADFQIEDGRIKMLRAEEVTRDRAGNPLRRIVQEFDYEKAEIRCLVSEAGEPEPRRVLIPIEGKVVSEKEIVSYLRGFPFRPGGELPFTMLDRELETTSILAVYEGLETVETPAGTFSCHKVRLVPDLGIATFLGKLVAPDLYLWFREEPPHSWVKYLGLEGSLGSPGIVSDLVEFHALPESPAR